MARRIPTELKCDKDRNRAFVRFKGGKIYFGKYGSKEADKAFAEWLLANLDEPKVVTPKSKITVSECVNRYLIHAANYYSKNGQTTQEYENVWQAMKTLLKVAGGRGDVACKFGPKKLKNIQKKLAEEHTLDKDGNETQQLKYARTSVNARIHRIRRCFRWCVSEEMIDVAIVTALDTVAGIPQGRTAARESVEVEPVPIQTVLMTLPFLSPTVSSMVMIQTLCGMRPQDVCRMNGQGICQEQDIWLYAPIDHKTAHLGHKLVKAIPLPAKTILIPWLRPDKLEPIFSPADSLSFWRMMERKKSTKPRPSTRPRRAYSTGSYGKAIAYGIQRARRQGVDIPHWSPNQLRHAIGTHVRSTDGVEAASIFLGHAKPDVTLIYAKRRLEDLTEIARRLISPFEVQKSEPLPASLG